MLRGAQRRRRGGDDENNDNDLDDHYDDPHFDRNLDEVTVGLQPFEKTSPNQDSHRKCQDYNSSLHESNGI